MREVTYHRVTSHINIDSSVLQRKSNALHIDICNPLLSLCMCYLYVTQHIYRDGNVLHMLHRDSNVLHIDSNATYECATVHIDVLWYISIAMCVVVDSNGCRDR